MPGNNIQAVSNVPHVDFYILQTDSLDARQEFVARLLDKLQKLGKTAHIGVESRADAEQLDALLWHFPPESFLPHCVDTDSGDAPEEPFIISAELNATIRQDVFINLRNAPPPGHDKIQRLVEVVVQEQAILTATRQNFRFYREQNYPIQSHPIRP